MLHKIMVFSLLLAWTISLRNGQATDDLMWRHGYAMADFPYRFATHVEITHGLRTVDYLASPIVWGISFFASQGKQATGLDAWASRVKCPARFVSHLHDICIYIWVVYSFCLFCCLFIIRHGLCHIYMIYVYIYELFIAFVCFVVCSLL